jgi:hypothetical protein
LSWHESEYRTFLNGRKVVLEPTSPFLLLAYQAIQAIRRKLKGYGIDKSWLSLRRIFSGQQRVTATFQRKDGRTLHVRKTTVPSRNSKNSTTFWLYQHRLAG